MNSKDVWNPRQLLQSMNGLYSVRLFKCETLLGENQGTILLDADWLQCAFQMTGPSLTKLAEAGKL